MERETMQDYEEIVGQINQACTLGELTSSEARKKRKSIRRELGIPTPLERMIFSQAIKIATSSLTKAYVTYSIMKSYGIVDNLIELIR
jgi:hypothetical protein